MSDVKLQIVVKDKVEAPVQNQLSILPIKVVGDIDLRPKIIVFQSAED